MGHHMFMGGRNADFLDPLGKGPGKSTSRRLQGGGTAAG